MATLHALMKAENRNYLEKRVTNHAYFDSLFTQGSGLARATIKPMDALSFCSCIHMLEFGCLDGPKHWQLHYNSIKEELLTQMNRFYSSFSHCMLQVVSPREVTSISSLDSASLGSEE